MERGSERDLLMAAAKRVLTRDGKPGFKVDAILKESGLSTRSFYRHFEKKDDLLFAILDEILDEQEVRLRQAMATADTFGDKIEAYLIASIDAAYNPKLTQRASVFALHWRELIAEYPVETRASAEKMITPLLEVMQAGKAAGEIECDDPLIEARALNYMLLSIDSDRAVLGEPGSQYEVERMVLSFISRATGLKSAYKTVT